MRHSAGFAILACLALAGPSATAAGRKSPASSHPAASASRSYRHAQRAPTRARYKEIQQALDRRGYDPGPVDGRWGPRSARALKRFERDHHLPADGKLDSLSLITLGLGPKHLANIPPEPSKTATTEQR